jgi:hypothetical protein
MASKPQKEMTNLVQRLRDWACGGTNFNALLLQAAARIEQLEAALKPQYDQQALELCDVCGWKAVIPGDGCLNCRREAALKPGEPVGWMSSTGSVASDHEKRMGYVLKHAFSIPLYTAQTPPPPRLTEQEINLCIKFPSAGSAMKSDGSTSQRIARAIETAVRKQAGWE